MCNGLEDRREGGRGGGGGGCVYVSEVAMGLTDVWRERTQEKRGNL